MTEILDDTRLSLLLDHTDGLIRNGDVSAGLCRLFSGLDRVRSHSSAGAWQHLREQVIPKHPLCELIHQDPMCQRAFAKPRGYAGDAVLLDYIYGIRSAVSATPLGRAIHDYCAGRASIRAVQHRRALLAHRIDKVADRAHGKARILSVACGHLREAELSAAVRSNWVGEIAAVDSDAESLGVAAAAHPALVTPWHMSVRGLLGRGAPMGKFDFIYSAGLYDYLEDAVAARLTRRLFAMLRRGGRLLICNFLPDVPDSGFTESLMGWNLILRKLERLPRFLAEIPAEQITGLRLYRDPFDAVGYLEVRRAC